MFPAKPRHPASSDRAPAPRAAGARPGFRKVPGGAGKEKRDREARLALDHLQRKGSGLWETWRRMTALEQDLRTILPTIALKPLKLENRVLLVTAASSALAARLRQYEPRLLDGLQARGWLVSRIRFKPNTVRWPEPPPPREKPPVSPRAIEALAALAESAEVTDALKASLQKFIRQQRSYHGES